MGVLDDIRSRCRAVAADARWVRIDDGRLSAYDDELGDRADAVGDPAHLRLGDEVTTVGYIVALDAVNFGSGWFPHLRKAAGATGYFAIAGALRAHVERYGVPGADELAAMTASRCATLFDQPVEGPAGELMERFAEAWRQLGRGLLDHHGGRPEALVAAADHSAERLIGLLSAMPAFEDRRRYRGLDVPFYKRAQITAADLALALGGAGLGRFDDLDRLTIFADNLVPHVLRVDGVLRLDPALAGRIDAGQLIPEGSDEEIELRAAAVEAVERLVARRRRAGRPATAMQLDEILWNRGQGPRYKGVPRPRCRTMSY